MITSYSKNLIPGLFAIIMNCSVFAQNDRQLQILKRLDSIAFAALENNQPDVLDKANKLKSEAEKYKSNLFLVNAHTIKGIVNKNKGYYVSSLSHYLKALSVAEKTKDEGRISACLNNIGTVYMLQENYTKALSYFNRSLEIERKLDQPLQKSIRYYNIGDAYNKMDSIDLALNFYTNSLLIEKRLNNKEGIIYADLGIAEIYLKADRLNDAENTLGEVITIIDESMPEPLIILFRLKGNLAEKQGKNDVALANFDAAENFCKQFEYRNLLPEIIWNKINLIERTGNSEALAKEYKKYIKLNEELASIKIKNQLADLTFQNEINKKELEIQLISKERDLARKNEISEKNIRSYEQKIVWFLLLSIILIVGLVIFGLKRLARQGD